MRFGSHIYNSVKLHMTDQEYPDSDPMIPTIVFQSLLGYQF